MDKQFEPSNPLSMPFECFEYCSDNDPFPVEEHWHYFGELLMNRSGTLLVSRGEEEHTLLPGEILFINPLIRHSIRSAGGERVVYNVIKLDLDQLEELPTYAPDLRSMMLEAERVHMPMHLSAADVHETHMDYMVRLCIEEFNERKYAYDLEIRAVIYMIVTSLVRLWIRDGFTLETRSNRVDPIYSVTSYIDRHIREALKVEELARYCGLSYPWFAKRFREIYGISCKEYIEKVRISKVEHYLLFTGYDLNYIARETGYADCSHMIKDFRRLKHITPGQYRANRKR